MKKLISLIFLLELFYSAANANPGDTSWVTIWNQRKLTYYGNYDTSATLPTGKRYRKIRLHYILGRYACPSGTQYCGSWDYTTQIYARPQNNDSVEIARIITPYATNWLSLNKKHDYVVDVTDYSPILDGPLDFRFVYQGYSYGFTITLKLEMIEGVPPMDPLSIKNIYNGYFPYGNNSNPIENYLTAKTYSYGSTVSKAFVKNFISGHGSDDNSTNCAEFCSKYYQLKLNTAQIAQQQLWRNDCGFNDVYPQTGTWVYDRANWCPGAVVWPLYHDVSSLTTANTDFTVDIDMQPYSAPNQGNATAGYNFISQLITYSVVNHSRDVSLEDIIAPSTNENYLRSNPNCNNPVIRVKNTGSDQVTQIVFSYGMQGVAPLTHTWTGALNFLSETDVVFPPSASIFSNNIAGTFEVLVLSVNGTAGDENSFNNIYSSKTGTFDVFPQGIVVKMFTNNSTDPATNKHETSWRLYDGNDNMIDSAVNLNNLTNYNDTVLLGPGCYKFVLSDAGCDGFNWWAYQYYNPNPGAGALRFDNPFQPGTLYLFDGDLGCGVTKYFRVNASPSGITESKILPDLIDVFPNPAQEEVFVKFDLRDLQTVNCILYDVTGKIVLEKRFSNVMASYEKIDISSVPKGAYFIRFTLNDSQTLNKKLIIGN